MSNSLLTHVWLFGPPGAGKSTLALALSELDEEHHYILDSDGPYCMPLLEKEGVRGKVTTPDTIGLARLLWKHKTDIYPEDGPCARLLVSGEPPTFIMATVSTNPDAKEVFRIGVRCPLNTLIERRPGAYRQWTHAGGSLGASSIDSFEGFELADLIVDGTKPVKENIAIILKAIETHG